ncbi:acetamidase [Verticiella sediminum]|uniref:Acetamidase n=1 Tax=Verticiella sediminum TaxID=1247510 RepID=A0A556A8Y9_9BURK|nr:acetamidase/formamidase family protein [Verticiella sediminum]TSH89354.1 acetamidase [Verticiella sediminum]
MTVLQHRHHHLPCTAHTTVWGYLSPDVAPALRIASGDTVEIDTISPMGVDPRDPQAFFQTHALPIVGAAREIVDILPVLEKGPGPHVLTGPIHVDGAEPGDVLEVRVLGVAPRAPHYGVNFTRPGAGSLPDLLDAPWTHVMHFDMVRGVAHFAPELGDIEIPLAPFMGIMGVAPRTRVSSIPPGAFGGNLDLRWLTAGARLYLPVQVAGALFFVGDGHAAQGDGEVDLTALETSMQGRFQFILHKQCPQAWPLAETRDDYLVLGLHEDLDEAARMAVAQAVGALQAFAGLPTAHAYAYCSLAVDFSLTQIVDGVKGVHGLIPKKRVLPRGEPWWGPRWPQGETMA